MSENAEGQPLTLVAAKSDRELAKDFRHRFDDAVVPLVALLNEANQAGLQIGFNIGKDQFGRSRVTDFSIVRPL